MPEPVYIYRAKCDRVVDGDTYQVVIDLGFECSIRVSVRLRDVNCPELSTVEGKAAASWVRGLLTSHPSLIVQSYRDKRTFARWVCDVWLASGDSLGDLIVAAGHGVRAAG